MLGSGVDPPFGPAREQTPARPADQQFWRIVAPLTQGELFFPPPFDYASSSALADNQLSGRPAVEVFRHSHPLQRLRYDVTVSVRTEDTPHVPARDIITHTAHGPEVLLALLAGLLIELEAAVEALHEQPEEGPHHG